MYEALPIRELKAQVLAKDRDAFLGTVGDASHMNASPPLDHTPYSSDEWPVQTREPVICAIDIGHHPQHGVDCNKIAARLLAEKPPWLKYYIWGPHGSRDVRRNWQFTRTRADHSSHLHISIRTDWINRSIAPFSLFGPGAATPPADNASSRSPAGQVHFVTSQMRDAIGWIIQPSNWFRLFLIGLGFVLIMIAVRGTFNGN